jgi:hypothetical protein
MNAFKARASTTPAFRLAALAFIVAGVFMAAVAAPAMAGVSGQLESWEEIPVGTEPGELLNAKNFGADPVDGSVYILSESLDFSEGRVDKFSPTGELEGSTVPLSRASVSGFPPKNFVGVAVDHSAGRFYLVETETGADPAFPEEPLALRLLSFSSEPTGSSDELKLEGTAALPGAGEAGEILVPNELHMDEANHELVISGRNSDGKVVLQRLDAAAIGSPSPVETAAYVESGNVLKVPAAGTETMNFGFDVAADGTTFLIARNGTEPTTLEAFVLPSKFVPPLGPLALEPLTGFTPAAEAGGWLHTSLLLNPAELGFYAVPQVAVTTDPAGEQTLYWKTGSPNEEKTNALIHGFSIQQEASTPAFGGGIEEPECTIETRAAALAATTEGDLMVLSPGPLVSQASAGEFGPGVFRFGPGGSECSNPAPLIQLKSGATEVSTVTAGTTVSLDASGSEEGETSIESLQWIIEGPGGSHEVIPVTDGSLVQPHAFAVAGDYTVRLKIKTADPVTGHSSGGVGDEFVAKPKTLTVTGGDLNPPVITKIEPTHGPATGNTTVKITGEHLAGATAVEFGTAAGTVVTDTGTEITVKSPSGAANTKAAIKVTTPAGSATSTEEFEWDLVLAPVITKIEPAKGPAAGGTTVKITGEHLGGASAVQFGTASGTVTADTETQITVTSPAGAEGAKAAISVTTPGGTVASTEQFEWEVVIRHKLVTTKGGSGSGTILCNGGACAPEYAVGTKVTLSAVADSGSKFTGWSGGGCAGTSPCAVVIGSADVTVAATFDKEAPPAGNNPGTGTGNSQGSTPPPPGGGKGGPVKKTPAQELQEKRKKAIAKCMKLKGKSKSKCLQKAHQIGKPKKKKQPKKKTAHELVRVAGRGAW